MQELSMDHVFYQPDEVEVLCPKCNKWFLVWDEACECGHEYDYQELYKFKVVKS